MGTVRDVPERTKDQAESTEFEIIEADLSPRPTQEAPVPNPLTTSSGEDLRRYHERLTEVARARSVPDSDKG